MEKTDNTTLKSKSIIVKKLLRSVVLVMTFNMLVSILGMMIDGVIIGRYLGPDSTAAYGLVAPILIIASLFGGLISSGAVTQLSQHKAKGETKEFNRTFTIMFLEGVIVGAIFITLLLLVKDPIVTFLGAKGDKEYLRNGMRDYINGLLPALPLIIVMELFGQVVQLDGNKKLPMISIFAMLVSDVALDILNVKGILFDGGLFGMALATTFSYYIAALTNLLHFFSKKCKLRFTFKKLPWRKSFKYIIKGLPNAVSRLMSALRTFALNRILVVVATSVAIAAFSVNNSAGNLMMAIGNGVAGSCVIISGVFLADKDKDSLKILLGTALKYAVVLSVMLSVVFFAFSKQIAGLFISSNEEVLNEAASLIRYYSIFVPFFAVNCCFYSYLQGIQNVKYSNIICAAGNGGLLVICALILGFATHSATGVWMAFPISGALSLVFIYVAAWIYQRHLPKSFEDLTFQPKNFDSNKENYIELSVTSKDQIVKFSEEVRLFCLEKSGDKAKAYKCSLCIEELLYNTFNYGTKNVKKPCVDTRVTYDNGQMIIRFRDSCNSFNPKEYYENYNEEDPTKHIGIRLVFSNATDIRYTNVFQLNNLIVRY